VGAGQTLTTRDLEQDDRPGVRVVNGVAEAGHPESLLSHLTFAPKASRQLGDPDESQDEAKVRLSDVLHRERDWLLYEYDFGDSWEHEVRVEKILPAPPVGVRKAACLGGARACPPEDCGGIPGYERLLKILANPKHPEHDETLEWIGESPDPATFDSARVDAPCAS